MEDMRAAQVRTNRRAMIPKGLQVVIGRQRVGDSLAETAEASAREAEGRASDAVTVSDNTTT
jgi:hypothetical protein